MNQLGRQLDAYLATHSFIGMWMSRKWEICGSSLARHVRVLRRAAYAPITCTAISTEHRRQDARPDMIMIDCMLDNDTQ